MLQGVIIVILSLTATMTAEEHDVFFNIEESYFLLGGNPIWDGEVDSLIPVHKFLQGEPTAEVQITYIATELVLFSEKDIRSMQKSFFDERDRFIWKRFVTGL